MEARGRSCPCKTLRPRFINPAYGKTAVRHISKAQAACARKEALLKRALGYEYEEKEVIASKNGKPERMQVIKRHVPPDVKALEKVRYLISIGKW